MPKAKKKPKTAHIVTITIQDQKGGDILYKFDFDPPIDKKSPCTPAIGMANVVLDAIRRASE